MFKGHIAAYLVLLPLTGKTLRPLLCAFQWYNLQVWKIRQNSSIGMRYSGRHAEDSWWGPEYPSTCIILSMLSYCSVMGTWLVWRRIFLELNSLLLLYLSWQCWGRDRETAGRDQGMSETCKTTHWIVGSPRFGAGEKGRHGGTEGYNAQTVPKSPKLYHSHWDVNPKQKYRYRSKCKIITKARVFNALIQNITVSN